MNFSKSNYTSLVLLAMLCLAFLFSFSDIIIFTLKGWVYFTRSYSLLIFAISAFMVWMKWQILKRTPIKPDISTGCILSILGIFIHLTGVLSHTLLIQGVAFVFTLLGIILIIFGRQYFKVLLIPVGYLIFMFSIFEEFLGNISFFLQLIAARIATFLLKLMGIPIFLHDNIIEMPHITLEVAKVCNGVNHIVALVGLAVPLAILSQRGPLRKILFVFFAVLLGIFMNGLRVALIGVWTIFNKGDSIHGPFNIFYVSFIMVFGIILLLITGFLTKHNEYNDKNKPPNFNLNSISKFSNSSIVIALSIFIFLNTYLYFFSAKPVNLKKSLKSFPKTIVQWTGFDLNDPDWPIKNFSGDIELKRIYTDASNNKIGLYISYFTIQKQDKEVITDSLGWLYLSAKVVKIQSGSEVYTLHKGRTRDYMKDQRLFYFFYDIDGKIYSDRYRAKASILFNNLIKRRNNGAFVAITVDDIERYNNVNSESHILEFIQQVFPIINEYLNSV